MKGAPRADLECSVLTNINPRGSVNNKEWNAGTSVIRGPSVFYLELIKRAGCEPEIRLRRDNSDPVTNLAIAAVGINIIKPLWIVTGAVAGPASGPPRQIDRPS